MEIQTWTYFLGLFLGFIMGYALGQNRLIKKLEKKK